jgi:hypothetical protein
VTRRSSKSIYEHILAHVEPGEPGLQEGGEALPDDADVTTEGGLRWAPGAREGTSSRSGSPAEDTGDRADELHRALLELSRRPGRRAKEVVATLFRTGARRSLLGAVVIRLRDEPPSDPNALYGELRRLLLETRSRDELKFAIAIVGRYGHPDDADVFRVLARHEEFTFYAAVALGYGSDDWVGEMLALLPDVSGWGATELSELLLGSEDERVHGVLLRQGVAIGNALTLAVSCRLHEALESDDVDDLLLRGAQSILDDLTWWSTGPESLFDYAHAGNAVERYLELLQDRASTLGDLISAYELGDFLEPDDDAHDLEERETALASVGFDKVRIARVQELIRAITNRHPWHTLTAASLESDESRERAQGIAAAERLGIPLHDYLVRRIEAEPDDFSLWHHLSRGADAVEIGEVVRLAERVLDLDALAPEPNFLHAADAVLQELTRFPGVGERLLLASLESPSSRHRLWALRALSRWSRESIRVEVWDAIERRLTDADERVGMYAAAVRNGEPLPD